MSGSMANMLGIPKNFVKEVYRDLMGKPAFSLVPIIMRPKSRGRLRLKSRNPFQWPKMQPNYLQHPDDLKTLVEGAKWVMNYDSDRMYLLYHHQRSYLCHLFYIIILHAQVKRLGESKSFQQYGSKLNRKPYLGCEKYVFGSDDYWKCCIMGYTSSLQHQVRD